MIQRDISKELDALKDDMKELRTDLGDLVSAIRGTAAGTAESAVDRVRGEARRRADQVKEVYHHARDRGEEAADTVRRQVKQKPLTGALIAMGIGFLFGRLLGWLR